MELHVLLALLLALAPGHTLTEDHHRATVPSPFLEPPPITRRHTPLIRRPPRHQGSKPAQLKGFWPSKIPITSKPATSSIARDFAYYDLQCNPCNSVPWIPIISFAYPNAAKPVHELPSPHANIPPHSYYNAINQLSANLVKPVSVVAPNYPFYIGPPVYQQHVQNPAWQAGINYPSAFSSPGASQQGAGQGDPLPQVTEPSKSVEDIGLSQWINEAKPIPLFHYAHSIDYPAQYAQTPTFDLPHQIPEAAPPVSETAYPTGLSQYATSGDSQTDVSNHLDDSKYSSSENKFSFTNNGTAKGKDLRSENDGESITNLTEYLTPPSTASGNGWSQVDDPDTELRPLDDWAFIKEIEPKNEKRKKQIQIVIPYTVNRSKHVPKSLKENTSWANELPNTSSSSTTVLPIVMYLKGNMTAKRQEGTDWQNLRKAIDSWTVERFSNHKYNSSILVKATSSTFSPSKEIPDDYLQSLSRHRERNEIRDRQNEIQNRVSSGTKGARTTTEDGPTSWKKLPVSVSPSTKEKVYIVTPLPLTSYNFSSNDIVSDNWNLL